MIKFVKIGIVSNRKVKNILFSIWAIGLVGVIGYLSLPNFFDNIIKIEVANIIEDSFNGKASYKNIKLSSFKDLPYLSISLDSVVLSNIVRQKPDTLFMADQISFSLSLNDWLFDHIYVVKKISFDSPKVNIRQYRNKVDNFSFLLQEDSASLKSDTSKFNFKINYFSIVNGSLFYKDYAEKSSAIAQNLFLKGSIDISNTSKNVNILFQTDDVVIKHRKITYLYKNTIKADLILDYNPENKRLAFNNHSIQIDDFKFGFVGYISPKTDTLDVDLKFNTEDSQLKNLMSLIPGIYKKDYNSYDARGQFSLNGEIKGLINAKQKLLPSYFAHFNLKNGYLKYNHLGNPITNISLDMRYEQLNTKAEPVFTLNQFHAQLDSNYISGMVTIVGTRKPFIVGKLNTVLELHEINKYLKFDSIHIAGHVLANLTVNGIYNPDSSKFPKMIGQVLLSNGYFNRTSIDHSLKNVEMETILTNTTGFIQNTSLKLSKLNLNIDDEYLEMYGKLEDFKRYNFDLFMRSEIDLSKLSKLLSIDNQTLTGFVNTKIIAKGSADKFKQAYISGTASLKDVHLINSDAEIDFKVKQGNMVFSPEMILISKFDAHIHNQAFLLNGTIRNFIPYFMHEKGVIQASLRLNADSLNLSTYFADVNSPTAKPDSSTIKQKIPQAKYFSSFENIDLDLALNINQLSYGKYKISKLVSNIKANVNTINLEKTAFNTLDASVYISTANITPNHFSVNLDINQLDTRKLMKLFYNTKIDIKQVRPETGALVDVNYKIKGELDSQLMPILNSLNGSGIMSVDKANIKGLKVLSQISKATEQNDLHHQEIHDATIETEIKAGKVFIKPFTVKLGNYITNFEGTHSFNNEINYFIKLGIPPFQKIKIPMHVTGTIDKPEVTISKNKKN